MGCVPDESASWSNELSSPREVGFVGLPRSIVPFCGRKRREDEGIGFSELSFGSVF